MQLIVLQKMLCVQRNHHHVLEHVVTEININLKYDPKTTKKIKIKVGINSYLYKYFPLFTFFYFAFYFTNLPHWVVMHWW